MSRSTRMFRPNRWLTGAAAASMALGLAACGGSDDDAAPDAPAAAAGEPAEQEPAAPAAENESAAEPDEDAGDPDPGQTALVGTAQIPDDFPADIPLPEPAPLDASSNVVVGQQQWSLQYELSGLAEAETYFAELETAGYPQVDVFDLSETQLSRTFSDDLHEVLIGTTGNGERLTFLMTVYDLSS